MPIYEYKCKECENVVEILQLKIDRNQDVNICSKCGGILERIISPTSFILKGTGWASTGYSKPEEKPCKETGGECCEGSCKKDRRNG